MITGIHVTDICHCQGSFLKVVLYVFGSSFSVKKDNGVLLRCTATANGIREAARTGLVYNCSPFEVPLCCDCKYNSDKAQQ